MSGGVGEAGEGGLELVYDSVELVADCALPKGRVNGGGGASAGLLVAHSVEGGGGGVAASASATIS
jgi:hypothetical protein